MTEYASASFMSVESLKRRLEDKLEIVIIDVRNKEKFEKLKAQQE